MLSPRRCFVLGMCSKCKSPHLGKRSIPEPGQDRQSLLARVIREAIDVWPKGQETSALSDHGRDTARTKNRHEKAQQFRNDEPILSSESVKLRTPHSERKFPTRNLRNRNEGSKKADDKERPETVEDRQSRVRHGLGEKESHRQQHGQFQKENASKPVPSLLMKILVQPNTRWEEPTR